MEKTIFLDEALLEISNATPFISNESPFTGQVAIITINHIAVINKYSNRNSYIPNVICNDPIFKRDPLYRRVTWSPPNLSRFSSCLLTALRRDGSIDCWEQITDINWNLVATISPFPSPFPSPSPSTSSKSSPSSHSSEQVDSFSCLYWKAPNFLFCGTQNGKLIKFKYENHEFQFEETIIIDPIHPMMISLIHVDQNEIIHIVEGLGRVWKISPLKNDNINNLYKQLIIDDKIIMPSIIKEINYKDDSNFIWIIKSNYLYRIDCKSNEFIRGEFPLEDAVISLEPNRIVTLNGNHVKYTIKDNLFIFDSCNSDSIRNDDNEENDEQESDEREEREIDNGIEISPMLVAIGENYKLWIMNSNGNLKIKITNNSSSSPPSPSVHSNEGKMEGIKWRELIENNGKMTKCCLTGELLGNPFEILRCQKCNAPAIYHNDRKESNKEKEKIEMIGPCPFCKYYFLKVF